MRILNSCSVRAGGVRDFLHSAIARQNGTSHTLYEVKLTFPLKIGTPPFFLPDHRKDVVLPLHPIILPKDVFVQYHKMRIYPASRESQFPFEECRSDTGATVFRDFACMSSSGADHLSLQQRKASITLNRRVT